MKIKVGVFFGGNSVEHEVSVITGIQACNSLDKEKYEIIPIYITKDSRFYIGENIGNIEKYSNIPELLKCSCRINFVNDENKINLVEYPAKRFGKGIINNIDVALPCVHGTNVEDGTLQGFLAINGIPYAGCDVTSSAICMDKYVTKAVLKYNNLPVLPCVITKLHQYNLKKDIVIEEILAKVDFPIIVKPLNLGSSVGIRIANTVPELYGALEFAFQFSTTVLSEKAIMNLTEINCAVLGDAETAEASECEQPVSSGGILSYGDKYMSNSKQSGMASLKRKIPADISPTLREKIRSIAVAAFKELGCSGVARVDFLMDNTSGEVYFNEINTIPGSLSFYLFEPIGMEYSVLLDKLIMLALKRSRQNSALNFSFDTNILSGFKFGGTKGGKL